MNHNSHTRPCQRDRLIALLKNRASAWVPLADVMAVAGAQYGARIYELRRLGHRIESKPGGGWFRLVMNPVPAVSQSRPAVIQDSQTGEKSLFGDLTPAPRHVDLG